MFSTESLLAGSTPALTAYRCSSVRSELWSPKPDVGGSNPSTYAMKGKVIHMEVTEFNVKTQDAKVVNIKTYASKEAMAAFRAMSDHLV